MVNTAMGSGPRYAPPDPTLPPPWRALVDGNTGYIYYWNPETNVTQYEKPLHPQAPPLPAGPPPTSTAASGPKLASLPSVASTVANDAQNGRSIDGHGETPNGSLHRNSGGGFHGNNTKTGSYPGGNLHGSNVGNVQGNTGTNVHGNMSAKVFSTVGGPVHGIVSGTAVRSANGSTQGATPATMHGNVRGTSYGSVSGPSHGSGSGPSHASVNGPSHGNAGGAIRGSSGSNLQSGSGGNLHGGNVPGSTGGSASGHPKLAAIPVSRGQQAVGGMHMTPHLAVTHATGVGPGPSSVSGSGSVAAYNKRSSNEYGFSDPDEYKRPRTQGYSGPPAASEIEAYKRQHEVTALGDNVPAPFMTFEAAGFPSEIMRELQAAGFTSPTPIQAQSWPIALQGRNVVAIAKTGSGKTLGYLLPAFIHLARHRNNSQLGPTVLVLAPTRELATQIQDEAVKFGRSSRIMSTCVYGGAPKGPQLRDIERGADIVIATPGRLNDFLEVKKVSLRQVSYLVLDEADRMLDMGFEPQIRKIVNEIPPRRQTLMYTATWPKEVRKIANDLMVNPVQVNIGNADELNANKSITQNVEMIPPYEKQRRLEQILRSQEPGSKIIIFCSTKKMCDQLARSLGRNFGAVAIHGDKSQNERDHVLSQFKCGRSPILVATDVAARGLDIKDIRVVINFDFPTGVEDYVHRIGRTGRAGATGVSYTFFSEQDGKYAKELIKVLEGASQKVPVELRDMASRTSHLKGRPGRWDTAGRGGRDGGRSSYGGGRGDGFGGRGIWNPAVQFDRRDRSYDRFGDRERFVDRDGGRNRYPNDRYHNRDSFKRFDDRDRGRSYSRSPSPSWSRGYSRSRSPSRSRSRSRSYDRFSDDRTQRSPYRKGHHGRSRSPYRRSLSPYQGGSPHRRNPTRNAYVISSYQSGPPIKAEPHESHSPHRAVPIETSSTKAAPIEAGSPHKVALKENSSPHKAAPIEIGSPRKASLCRRGLPQGNASPSWSKSLPRMAMSPLRSHSPPRRLYAPYESSPSPQRGDKTYQSEPPSFRDGSPHQSRSLGSLSLPRRGPSPTGSGSPSRGGALPSQGGLLPSSSPARGASPHQTGSPSSRSSPAHQDEMHASLSSPYQCVSPSCNDTVPCQDGLSGNLSSPHPVVSPNQNGLPFQKGITPYSSGSPPKNILPH